MAALSLTSAAFARWLRRPGQPRDRAVEADGHCAPPRARARGTDQGMPDSNRPEGSNIWVSERTLRAVAVRR
jgi:hypothetical protein